MSISAPPPISAADYTAFCSYFYDQTGISFNDAKRYFVDKHLQERMEKTGTRDCSAYLTLLRRAPGEVERITNLLTVNETYFFREDYQFDCMINSLLPELTARRPRGSRLRIWSLPCSTGEEPYSIAIILLERFRQVDEFDIEILASDIDTKVLAAAQEGVYDQRSLQRLPEALIRRYFTRTTQGRWKIIEDIRQSVSFSTVNASDPRSMRAFSEVDLVFCRNMLIYFDDRSRLAAVQHIYDSMNNGGFICLGHSELMNRITYLFHRRNFPDASVYQKPLEGA